MKDKEVIKDYNVYNTLNLICEELGESYLKNGFNPFNEGFILDEKRVLKYLNKKEIQIPNILEDKSNLEVMIQKSLDITIMLIKDSPTKIVESLKLRIELLKIILKKLQEKQEVSRYLKLLYLINPQLEKALIETFSDCHLIELKEKLNKMFIKQNKTKRIIENKNERKDKNIKDIEQEI